MTLSQVKAHLRIELDQTAEDEYLVGLEAAARIHAENVLRTTIDDNAGENIERAMLMLIGHWYRNRETVAASDLAKVPLGFDELLAPERDYSGVY